MRTSPELFARTEFVLALANKAIFGALLIEAVNARNGQFEVVADSHVFSGDLEVEAVLPPKRRFSPMRRFPIIAGKENRNVAVFLKVVDEDAAGDDAFFGLDLDGLEANAARREQLVEIRQISRTQKGRNNDAVFGCPRVLRGH